MSPGTALDYLTLFRPRSVPQTDWTFVTELIGDDRRSFPRSGFGLCDCKNASLATLKAGETIRGVADKFDVNPSTVQRIKNPFVVAA